MHWEWGINMSNYYWELSIFPFCFFNFCLIYFQFLSHIFWLLLDIQTFITYIFHLCCTFSEYKMYFLFSLIFFDLKSILSDISIATPALFWSLFHEHLFRPFFVNLFSIYLCLWIWVSWKKQKLGHIWVIFVCYFHPINLCLFIGEFDPFTFKLITNKERLTSITVLFVFDIPCIIMSLISCITIFFGV